MKFANTEVFNLKGAMRGMRNPKDSWHLNDSTDNEIGINDLKLAQALIKGGSEHRKFLRQIMVCVDIAAPRYWWQEFDTYKVGTTANSTSTMHKLHAYPITIDMFEVDTLDFNEEDTAYWDYYLKHLEKLRLDYLTTKKRVEFRKLKQALHESYLNKRTVTLNYEVIYNMIHQRKSHRLNEWRVDFIGWVKSLPHYEELLDIK